MAFGQIHYQEKVGNGNYTIAQIGCFITAFCNLLVERYGENIDPATLNNFFTEHGVYLADPGDGAGVRDNLSWGSISSYDGTIHVMATGGAGWPSNNNAIVKFSYGNGETHFCLVADAANHVIVDSWDGVTKSPNQYESVYGSPVAWAEYEKANPQVVAPTQTQAPTPAPSEGNYRVVTAIPGYGDANNAANHISPADTVLPGNYIIYNQHEGMINVTYKAGVPGSWINPGDNVAPTPPAVAAADPAIGPANYDGNEITIQPGWGLSAAAQAAGYPDYSNPLRWEAIASLNDSSDWQAYNAELKAGQRIVIGKYTPPTSAPAAPAEDGAEKIDVKVLPADPNKWQQSYVKGLGNVVYIASQTEAVHDLANTQSDQELVKGMTIDVAGKFTGPDSKEYYRTVKSVTENYWYGIPVDSVIREDDISDEELKGLLDDAESLGKEIKSDKILQKAAAVEGKLAGIFHRNKK